MQVTLNKTYTTNNPVEAMANAASKCYNSKPHKGIVKHCLESGHYSITEFADFYFEISGVSRTLTHQLVRHRHFSFAQRSQRYVNEDGFGIVIPKTIQQDEELLESFKEEIGNIKKLYQKMVDNGIPNEDARFILPNATESIIVTKMNFRSLMEFCHKRLCTRAQWEIREMTKQMVEEIKKISPFLVQYLVSTCEYLGYCPEGDCCGRMPKKDEVLKRSISEGLKKEE
jgi:thymidylate synthase (FAD)